MKVLICPLNWGLGHATRCVPIIRKLIAEGHEPVIVSDGFPLVFLRQEFPTLRTIEYPSYAVYYAPGKSQVGAMLFNLPRIMMGIYREHHWLNKLLESEHFDQVISDNRFGMWSKKVHSIYITHQLMVKMPRRLKILEPLIHGIHRRFINRYKECWIPDSQESRLAGDLAHRYPPPPNAKFIGALSRFDGKVTLEPNLDYEVVAILSGVEPQRALFEQSLIHKYQDFPGKSLIVCGQPRDKMQINHIGNITLVSHLSDSAMASALLGAQKIISRSGYSTIMDLVSLSCLHKAELIPTPGQTEQEYLKSIAN